MNVRIEVDTATLRKLVATYLEEQLGAEKARADRAEAALEAMHRDRDVASTAAAHNFRLCNTARAERDALGKGIADAAVARGILAPGTSLTGPQLLLLCKDLSDMRTERVAKGCADDLRAAGWRVAVHNDYRQEGKDKTFWLLTHPCGYWIKGEGFTDAEALDAARCQAAGLTRLQSEPTPAPLHCACCYFDDDSAFALAGFAGGAAPGGAFSSIDCVHKKADGTTEFIHYVRAPPFYNAREDK